MRHREIRHAVKVLGERLLESYKTMQVTLLPPKNAALCAPITANRKLAACLIANVPIIDLHRRGRENRTRPHDQARQLHRKGSTVTKTSQSPHS